jgi:hypothetical protein
MGPAAGSTCNALNLLSVDKSDTSWKTWQIEVLDRALLYEGPALADRLCWENGVFSFCCLYLLFLYVWHPVTWMSLTVVF